MECTHLLGAQGERVVALHCIFELGGIASHMRTPAWTSMARTERHSSTACSQQSRLHVRLLWQSYKARFTDWWRCRQSPAALQPLAAPVCALSAAPTRRRWTLSVCDSNGGHETWLLTVPGARDETASSYEHRRPGHQASPPRVRECADRSLIVSLASPSAPTDRSPPLLEEKPVPDCATAAARSRTPGGWRGGPVRPGVRVAAAAAGLRSRRSHPPSERAAREGDAPAARPATRRARTP